MCVKLNSKVIKSGHFASVSSYGKVPQFKGLNSKHGIICDTAAPCACLGCSGLERVPVWLQLGRGQGQKSPC